MRFDYFQTSFPEQTVGPAPLTPNRNITFPAQDNISWKDITYRSGLAYDLFGNGKTAVKVAFNKYLLGQTLNGLGRNPNPVLTLVTLANRPWNDRGGLGINRDYVPQCNLLNPLANGECGRSRQPGVRHQRSPSDLYDKDLISGFNHRQANWEFSAGVQHELMPRHRARRRLLPPRLGELPGDRQHCWSARRTSRSSAWWRRPTRACRTAAARR